jgi:hypothetical protein
MAAASTVVEKTFNLLCDAFPWFAGKELNDFSAVAIGLQVYDNSTYKQHTARLPPIDDRSTSPLVLSHVIVAACAAHYNNPDKGEGLVHGTTKGLQARDCPLGLTKKGLARKDAHMLEMVLEASSIVTKALLARTSIGTRDAQEEGAAVSRAIAKFYVEIEEFTPWLRNMTLVLVAQDVAELISLHRKLAPGQSDWKLELLEIYIKDAQDQSRNILDYYDNLSKASWPAMVYQHFGTSDFDSILKTIKD